MNYKMLLQLSWEFAGYIESLHTLYLDCIAGFSILHDRLLNHQEQIRNILGNHEYATEKFQDTCSMLYKDLCDKDFIPVSMSPVMKQRNIKERTKKDGKNYFLLGAQCVVSAYSYWEEYLRIEIGKAVGVLEQGAGNCDKTRISLNKHIVSEFWGDMRYLRNSIIHNNNVASSDIAKCNTLKWFKPGDKIELDFEKMELVFDWMGIYRNALYGMSRPPRKGIRIPVK